MKVPIFDLKRQSIFLRKEVINKTSDVLLKGNFILGENVELFEKEFAKFCGVRHAIGVASGTDAIRLAIKALDLTGENEVIVPANAYPTAFAVAEAGVVIKLVDVDEQGLIDLRILKKSLTKRTKAIIPVHLYGNPVNVPLLKRIVGKKIYIIEDAAQAHGSSFDGRSVGSMGDVGCFSFYPTKNLGAFGDGGLITTNNKKLDKKLRMLRVYGEKKRYESDLVSGVSRLDELQAAILRIKLKRLRSWNNRREQIAKAYMSSLKNLKGIKAIGGIHKSGKSSWHLFVITAKKRNSLKVYLKKNGIDTLVHYPKPVHLQKSFSYLGYKKGDFPVAEKMSGEVLSLPLFPELKDEEIKKVVSEIKKFYEK